MNFRNLFAGLPARETFRSSRSRKIIELGLLATALGFLAIVGLPAWISSCVVLLIWLGLRYQERWPSWAWSVLLVVGIVLILASTAWIARTMVFNLEYPTRGNGRQEWDFLCFWADGRVAVSGQDFYDPASYLQLELPAEPRRGFRHQILEIGFRYPPVTMLLFAPLGLFDYSVAYALWNVLNSVVLFLCALFISKKFFLGSAAAGFVTACLMLLATRGVWSTLRLGQTNLLILLCLLIAVCYPNSLRAGVFLALGAVAKPLVLILFLPELLKRSWRTVFGLLIGLVAAGALTVIFFGADAITSYLGTLPSNVPLRNYLETPRQSLLAGILRLTGWEDPHVSPVRHPLFVVTASLLVGLSAWLTLRTPKSLWSSEYGYWVPLMLLVYPGTLHHYAMFLIVPFLILWRAREVLTPWDPFTFLLAVVIFFGASSSWSAALPATLVCWALMAGYQVWENRQRSASS